MVAPFDLVSCREVGWGWLAAIRLPGGPDAVPPKVLSRLDPAEASFVARQRGFRPSQFAGGRLALRAAAGAFGTALPAVLPDSRGAPLLPAGLVGSVSHKRHVAWGMVGPEAGWRVGLDFEERAPERPDIARLVLRPEEAEENTGWESLLLRFSLKEALYKALDPFVRRYVGFREVAVWPRGDGSAVVDLLRVDVEAPLEVEARYEWERDGLLTLVRVRPGGEAGR